MKAKKPVKSVALGKKALKAGTDYDVAYSGNVNAGTAKAKVTSKGAYAGSKSVAFKIKPAANKLVVKAAAKKVKASAKAQTVQLITKATPKFKAKVTYSKAATAKAKWLSGYKVLFVDKKTGKVKVKAGTRPGTYKLMVKVTAAKTKNTKAAVSRTVTVTVKVEADGKATKAQSANTQAARPLTAAAF